MLCVDFSLQAAAPVAISAQTEPTACRETASFSPRNEQLEHLLVMIACVVQQNV